MAIALDFAGTYETTSTDSMLSGSTTITSTANPWEAGDVGKTIFVATAGAGSTTLKTTITSFVGAGEIVVADANASGGNKTNVLIEWFTGTKDEVTAGGLASMTWKHTCSGSNRYLVVGVFSILTDPNYFLAARYNGVDMTQLDTYLQSATRRATLFGLVAPATGSNTVEVYDTGSTARVYACTSMSFTGVHQSTPTGTPAHNGNGSGGTDVTLNVTSAVGEVVVDLLCGYYKTTTWTADGTGQTVVADLKPDAGSFGTTLNGWLKSSTTPGAATTTVSYTASATEYWAISAIPLKPAAGGDDGLMWL